MRSFLSRVLFTLEAAFIGVFFIQALRYLLGEVYARISSATIYPAIDLSQVDPAIPGLISPSVVSGEISLLVYMLSLPLIALVFGRLKPLLVVAVLLASVGRALMLVGSFTPAVGAALTIGGGLMYFALLVRQRPADVPYMFILGFAVDQMFRAFGNTLDPSWSPDYAGIQIGLSVVVIVLSLANFLRSRKEIPAYGLMPVWGGLGFGALLFLEISLLGLPNTLARRAYTDYTLFVPFTLAATLLPLLPWIRNRARGFISLFDSGVRGWVWMLMLALLVVFGTRFGLSGVLQSLIGVRSQAMIAGIALVIAQFCASLMWWWLVRPQAEKERNFSGLWIFLGMLVFVLLYIFDLFTYEYAYVRDLDPRLAFLNDIIPPLLRGFRGMGLAVLLLAIFIAALPMIQVQRRIPWTGGTLLQSLAAALFIAAMSSGAAYLARPPVVNAVRNVEAIRIATYNVHAGFNEFFHFDLEAIASTIQRSGANVVLLQEVETGRMTSFAVDQALWLGRRLGMDVRFYPTNEGLQGLAVLSNVEIVFDEGTPLTSIGNQTAVQRVQIRPDEGVITIYNTWLGLLWEGGDQTIAQQEQDQDRQLSEIFSIISRDHPTGVLGRTIIGGTFNNVPDSPLVQRMRDVGFLDPFATMVPARAATFWQTGRRARLDYIWLRNIPGPFPPGVLEDNASDHRLALVEVPIAR